MGLLGLSSNSNTNEYVEKSDNGLVGIISYDRCIVDKIYDEIWYLHSKDVFWASKPTTYRSFIGYFKVKYKNKEYSFCRLKDGSFYQRKINLNLEV